MTLCVIAFLVFNFYLFPYLFVDLPIIFGPFNLTIHFLQISKLVTEINAFISITMIHFLRLFARRSVTVSVTTLMSTVTGVQLSILIYKHSKRC